MDPKIIADAATTATIVASVASALKADATTKIVEDLSPITQQLGKLGESIFQIVSAPFQVAASHAQRIVWLVQAANGQIPEERRQVPSPSVAGPIFENVKYLEDGNPLLKFYEQLLASAMDRDKVQTAHPAFAEIIKHLSSDEALILYRTARGRPGLHRIKTSIHSGTQTSVVSQEWHVPLVAGIGFGTMYMHHLQALYLLEPKKISPEGETELASYQYLLTPFGEVFAKACIPEHWEEADWQTKDSPA